VIRPHHSQEYAATVTWEEDPTWRAGPLPALLLNQGSLPFGLQAREEEQGLRLAKDPGMRGFVLLLAGVVLCCLGILLSLPATTPHLASDFARADAAQVDGGASAPLPNRSYPITPAEEVQEADRHPVNTSLLTMLLLSLSFGASVLYMATNERGRAANCVWDFEDRAWLAVAHEDHHCLGCSGSKRFAAPSLRSGVSMRSSFAGGRRARLAATCP
jgi:hypothetical protein